MSKFLLYFLLFFKYTVKSGKFTKIVIKINIKIFQVTRIHSDNTEVFRVQKFTKLPASFLDF